ncbi:DoxX family protein [Flavobacterium sp. F-65]|jgi:putative oxidoreductase|uniref:DoxX family protein n=1 Tax=Flavobacterium pisciphilum TaxID=2893755 RepID=A0ABS8MNK4_9FLAO|nr:DoxX family protein [Flavobacterium sp. F-65]MCC9070347.1 DoxX family protein [Flavobacterium sp. F-65]
MNYIPLIGRILFSAIFMYSSIANFSDYYIYEATTKGIPSSYILVPLVGIFELLGGLSILTGFMAKWGAWLIILILLPVTIFMHDFWNIEDPVRYQFVLMTFMRNLSIIGAALMISFFGAGPYSFDEYKARL